MWPLLKLSNSLSRIVKIVKMTNLKCKIHVVQIHVLFKVNKNLTNHKSMRFYPITTLISIFVAWNSLNLGWWCNSKLEFWTKNQSGQSIFDNLLCRDGKVSFFGQMRWTLKNLAALKCSMWYAKELNFPKNIDGIRHKSRSSSRTLRATSHTTLRARDHCTSSTLIGVVDKAELVWDHFTLCLRDQRSK